ncbi:signal peptidase I [Nanoarchaeota archaeon]
MKKKHHKKHEKKHNKKHSHKTHKKASGRPKSPYSGKNNWQKFWYFIWEDDSIWSWLANIALAFILIKFIVYPGLGLVLGTSHPIVAVVSGSMEHQGSFDEWYSSTAVCSSMAKSGRCTQKDWYLEHNITRADFEDFSFKNGFNTGDIMVLIGKDPENLKKGDIIVFRSLRQDPIIHRIVVVSEKNGYSIFQTKGDHNIDSIKDYSLNEYGITENIIIGKAVLRVPYLGYVKILFIKVLQIIGIL